MDGIKRKPEQKKNKPPVNEYFHRLAGYVRVVRYIVLFAFVAVILGGITLFRDDITIQNISHLLRYIDIQTASDTGLDGAAIYIDGSPDMAVGYYKGEVVLVKTSGVELYDFSGSKTFTYSFDKSMLYQNPVILTSDKYILSYDLSGNKFALFNSFSNVYLSDKTEALIYGACINNDGSFAVVSTASGYRSVVSVYSNAFKKLFSWSSKDKYVMDISLHEKDGLLATASFTASQGDYLTVINVFDVTKEETMSQVELNGCVPVDVTWVDDRLVVITDKEMLIYDRYLNRHTSFDFGGRSLGSFTVQGGHIVMALGSLSIDSSTYLYIYNTLGKLVYTEVLSEDLLDVASGSECAYLLSRQGLSKVKYDERESVQLAYDAQMGADKIIHASNDRVIVVSANSAEVHGENMNIAAPPEQEQATQEQTTDVPVIAAITGQSAEQIETQQTQEETEEITIPTEESQ